MDSARDSDPWSVSDTALYRTLRRRLERDEPSVLATIVDVEGSAYRRPGAKMLIAPGQESLGAVTAGCLEGPVIELASQVLEDGRPRIETFDLMDDGEWGLGLGCNGIIDILLEPVDQSLAPALTTLENRDPVTILTVIESSDPTIDVGGRTVLDAGGEHLPTSDRQALPDKFVAELSPQRTELRGSGGATSIERTTDDGMVTIFLDRIEPAPRLLLFGNQNDVQPVSRLGREVGFEVVVASARGSRSTSEAFPAAHDVVVTHPTDVAAHTDEQTYVVLMSHNLLDDRLALEALQTGSDVPYIGLMGPRERFEEMREEMAADGTTLSEEQLERLSTPVGLDLGGGEPIQIALSIVSEVLAVSNDRSGGRLKDREGPIHERTELAEQ